MGEKYGARRVARKCGTVEQPLSFEIKEESLNTIEYFILKLLIGYSSLNLLRSFEHQLLFVALKSSLTFIIFVKFARIIPFVNLWSTRIQ